MIDFPKYTGECQIEGCKNNASFGIGISLSVHPDHKPARTMPLVWVCTDHKYKHDFNDFIGAGDNWKMICEGFHDRGLQEPKKEFSSLYYTEIN